MSMVEKRKGNNLKKYLALSYFIIFLLISNTIWAQKGLGLRAGIGNYDLSNIGIQYQVSKRSSFEVVGGTNLGLNNRTQWATGLYFNQVFLKPIVWEIRPGYSLGGLYWTWKDDLYNFRTMSAPFMVLLVYNISPNLSVRAENGVAFSIVLESTRKQNVKAGFPDRIRYAGGLTFIYKIKRNENK